MRCTETKPTRPPYSGRVSPATDLTPRERATLQAVARRFSNAEIAAEFGISVRTVESHVAALRRKLGADSRADLVQAFGERMLDDDVAAFGHVMNVTRLWATDPVANDLLFDLLRHVGDNVGLGLRHRLLVVLATSAARGSGYCALAWSSKFPDELEAATAAAVVAGNDDLPGLDARDAALVRWARRVSTAGSPVPAAAAVQVRAAGWSQAELFAVTVFAALRTAFSSVNDAVGAAPDEQLLETAPPEVVAAWRGRDGGPTSR